MNRIYVTMFLLVLISCKKEPSQGPKWTEADKKITAVKPAPKGITPKVDTIEISGISELDSNMHILASFLDKKIDKDSIITVHYNLDFYSNKRKIGSEKIAIVNFTEGSNWGASFGLSQDYETQVSPFIKISFGYEACGYNQQHFLFYLKDTRFQLVHEWDSMSDGGWGGWVEFGGMTPSKNPVSFHCKTVYYMGKEDDEQMGTVQHLDSTKFILKNNRWEKQLLTPKEKVYWEKDIAFNDFYPQQTE